MRRAVTAVTHYRNNRNAELPLPPYFMAIVIQRNAIGSRQRACESGPASIRSKLELLDELRHRTTSQRHRRPQKNIEAFMPPKSGMREVRGAERVEALHDARGGNELRDLLARPTS